ncbi:MAG: AcrR family transcriptional regulator [Myxococcota bacterium]|jgi:AcrR family transcriptional regulator
MPDNPNISTRERLLMSGALLFAEKGFKGGSVREICEHAGTSMNMIHHYFGSKAGLMDAIVEQFSSRVFEVPMRLLDPPAKSQDDFRSRIEMVFEATLDAYIEQRLVLMVVVREQADPPALIQYMNHFTAFLEQAKQKGFVRNELDVEMVTGVMLDRISNQVQFAPWVKRNYGTDLSDPEYKKRWCASNLDLFLNGMLG